MLYVAGKGSVVVFGVDVRVFLVFALKAYGFVSVNVVLSFKMVSIFGKLNTSLPIASYLLHVVFSTERTFFGVKCNGKYLTFSELYE